MAPPTKVWNYELHGPNIPRGWMGGLPILGIVIAVLAYDSFFTVQPTEMAGVRRLGTVVSAQPIGPGLHFKAPLIDTVDRIQTSLAVMRLGQLQVYTVDNQAIEVGIGVTFDVPADAVMHLLYDVGKTGNLDIEATIQPVIADRAMRVFATQNTTEISAHREKIAIDIRQQVADAVKPLFGIRIRDLQIAQITYSANFEESVARAVEQKNRAIAAHYAVETAVQEGDQRRAAAQADAAVAIAQAEGAARASVASAKGRHDSAVLDAQASIALGDAKAHVLQVQGQAVAANPALVEYTKAAAWNGVLPSTVAGGALPMLGLNTVSH